MTIELLDYKGERKAFDIPEKEDIYVAIIQVLSGDETLHILTKDGKELYFDASDKHIHNYDDGIYCAYGPGVDKFSDPKWLARTSAEGGSDAD